MSQAALIVQPTPWPPTESMAIAARFLGLSLRDDYLSTGQGHQQSRRIMGDRMAKRSQSGGTDVSALSTIGGRQGACAPRDAADIELRYFSEVARRPRLTSREEYGLAVRMKRGDRQAHDAIIEANLGLVVMFARRYQRTGVPLMDLIAEGNMGLLTAAKRFDPEMGYRFATYAKWWVRQAIQLALPKLIGVVRMPASHLASRRLEGHHHAVTKELRSQGTGSADVAQDTSLEGTEAWPSDAPAVIDNEFSTEAFPHHHVACIHVDLDDAQALEAITIPVELEPPGAAMAVQRTAVLRRALDGLCERDRTVVIERYALFDDRACTLDELSQRFQVSIERIRQIENAAVKKLCKALSEAGESAATLL